MKVLKKIGPWIVYSLVAYFMFATVRDNIEQVKHYSILQPWLLVVGALLYALFVLGNSLVWGQMMKYVSEKVSLAQSVYVYVSSYIIRYIPGNVWAIAARAAINKQYGVKTMTSIWGWVIENVMCLFVGLAFSCFVILNVPDIPRYIVWIVTLSLPFCGIFLLKYEWLERFVRIVVKKRLPENTGKDIGTFSLSGRNKIELIGMYLILWLMYSLQFYAVVHAVVPASGFSFWELAGINALAWTIGFIIIIAPSGIGIKEGVMIVALTSLGSVEPLDALVIALLARTTTVVGELLLFVCVRILYSMRAIIDGKQRKND